MPASPKPNTSSDTFDAEDAIRRFVLFPIKQPKLWTFYKEQFGNFWGVHEVDTSRDRKDFETKLDDNERHFIKHVLAFFAASDGIVSDNIALNFYDDMDCPEAKFNYAYQMMIENVHSEMYSLLIEELVADPDERLRLFQAVQNFPCVQKKARWAMKWMGSEDARVFQQLPEHIRQTLQNSDDPECKAWVEQASQRPSFARRLVAFASVEGIFFSGSFCAIDWLHDKDEGVCPGISKSNEWIRRDEGQHQDFAALLYNDHIPEADKLSQEEVYAIVDEAVTIEKEFIIDALPCTLLGMNAREMATFIENRADQLLVDLGYPKKYGSENPFGFMENRDLETKTDFFAEQVADYGKLAGGEFRTDLAF